MTEITLTPEDKSKEGIESNRLGHEPVKLGNYKYGCPICPKIVQNSAAMKHHIMTHTGERPFSCSECGKTFAQKSYLKYHNMIHTGEMPFSCNDCDKTFVHKQNLQVHLKSKAHAKKKNS